MSMRSSSELTQATSPERTAEPMLSDGVPYFRKQGYAAASTRDLAGRIRS
jgi:hypothetical protein